MAEIKSSSHFVRSGFVTRFVKKFPSLCYHASVHLSSRISEILYFCSVDKLRSLLLRCPIMRINWVINAWRITCMTQGKLRTPFFRILVVSVDESSVATTQGIKTRLFPPPLTCRLLPRCKTWETFFVKIPSPKKLSCCMIALIIYSSITDYAAQGASVLSFMNLNFTDTIY